MDRDPDNFECTRDPIFLLQVGQRQWTQIPDGLEGDGDSYWVNDADLLPAWIKPFVDGDGVLQETAEFWKIAENAENDHGWPMVYIEWRTETVFLTRPEAKAFAERHAHRWPLWQVYCTTCDGELARLLKECEPTNLPDPDCDRCDGTGWYEGGPTLKTDCECLRRCFDKRIAEFAVERVDNWRELYRRLNGQAKETA